MPTNEVFTIDSIDGDLCQFEHGERIGEAFGLFNPDDYPAEYKKLIDEVNVEGQKANDLYKMAKHREQMFASGFNAGMYIARFNENEELISFEFTDGTRRMLGYDGLEDLPNEFDSWIKTLIPEERDTLVKLFWDTVKIHRELPDISHAEYRMMKKDGSIIWVTGAGEFVRRADGSLEIYMGCYREVTAEHEKEEHLHIIEGVGKVFNFSIYIDAKTENFRIISSNEYTDEVERCENAFAYLRAQVECSVAEEYKEELKQWFDSCTVLGQLKDQNTISKDFYSDAADAWFRAIFMVSDYDENGEIAHIIYGCQNIDAAKRLEIENQKEILSQYKLLKSMSKIYYSLHEIDLVRNTNTPYNANETVKKYVNHKHGADKMMRDAMIAFIMPEFLDEALEFTDLSTVSERLKNKKIISAEFKGINLGWFVASFILVEHDDDGNATKVVFTIRGIDDIKQKEEMLIKKSHTDELTGVLNRTAYEETIGELNENGIGKHFVYMSIDVNGLKVVNDSLGHSAGDELIVGASKCLTRTLGQYGKVFRTGGDEFVVLLNAKSEQLKVATEALDVATSRWSGNQVDELSMSYGYVTSDENPDMSINDFALLADKRMYEAKTEHYRRQGVDRKGQKEAHTALCALYTKILKINISNDSYQIVNMDLSEQDVNKGFSSKLSDWFREFGISGQVHADDLEEYLEKTDLSYLEKYFSSGKTSFNIQYRRKFGDVFRQVMMEIIPASDYKEDNKSFFLYVKSIDK